MGGSAFVLRRAEVWAAWVSAGEAARGWFSGVVITPLILECYRFQGAMGSNFIKEEVFSKGLSFQSQVLNC